MHELETQGGPFSGTPNTAMSPLPEVYASGCVYLCWPRCQGDSQGEGNCICQSPAAFCQTEQPAKEERAVPIGREHHGTEEGSRILFVFH